jgi:hypothetical protein
MAATQPNSATGGTHTMITSIDLTDAEWSSLQELRKGPLRKKIPLPHELKLINLGFAKQLFDTVVATAVGRRIHRAENGGNAMVRDHSRPPSLKLVVLDIIKPSPFGAPRGI